MITEWLVGVGAGFGEWVASLFPEIEVPDWLENADDFVNGIFAYGDGLGAWVDWGLVTAIAAVPLGTWVLLLAVRGARVVISHLPFIGGRG